MNLKLANLLRGDNVDPINNLVDILLDDSVKANILTISTNQESRLFNSMEEYNSYVKNAVSVRVVLEISTKVD